MQLDTLERGQLASRLTLNCSDNYVEPQKLKDVYVTIMDVSRQKKKKGIIITVILELKCRYLMSQHYLSDARKRCTSVTQSPKELI